MATTAIFTIAKAAPNLYSLQHKNSFSPYLFLITKTFIF